LGLKRAVPGSVSDVNIVRKVRFRGNKIDIDNQIRFRYPEGRWLYQGGGTISMVGYPTLFIQWFIAG